MTINCVEKNRTLIVKITGEIDHCTANDIKYKTDKEYKILNSKNILFDLSEVTFMDSSGIGVIMGRYKNVSSNGGIVGTTLINDEIKKIFELSGLFKIIKYYKNTEDALTAFSEGVIKWIMTTKWQ